jgi:hypothetical protein
MFAFKKSKNSLGAHPNEMCCAHLWLGIVPAILCSFEVRQQEDNFIITKFIKPVLIIF